MISSSALSATWYYAPIGNDEAEYYFDFDTIEKTKTTVLIWTKSVRTESADKDGSWATANRHRFNCSKRTIQTMASSDYDQQGKFIKSYPNPGPEREVFPDSIGEAGLKMVCASDFPNNKSEKFYLKVNSNDIFAFTRALTNLRKAEIDTAPK